MGADKAQFADRVFEFAHAVHAFIGIDACQTAKTLRIFLDHVGDHFIGQLPVRRMALAAGFAGRDKCQLNSRRIHSFDIFFDRQAVKNFFVGADFSFEEFPPPFGLERQHFGGVKIDDDVDGSRH